MPHVIVKLHSGRSEADKSRLADQITKAVTGALNLGDESVSVGIEDVEPKDWVEHVYKPEILTKGATIYKKPGYNPL